MTKFRYANTAAATMLTDGLRSAALERGLSLREIGRRLGYKQPVVLSHMAKGRVPVPIDRAVDIAREVGLAAPAFLKAALQQQHPDTDWRLISGEEPELGTPLGRLSPRRQQIVKEVLDDPRPEERWIDAPEVPTLRLLRQLFPQMQTSGLSEEDQDKLRLAAHLSEVEKLAAGSQSEGKQKK